MPLTDYLVTDDLTIILGLVGAGLFLLHNLYRPQSLVHPILLGRQSDVARVRNPGESAVYRNYGTGMLGRVCLQVDSQNFRVVTLCIVPHSTNQRTTSASGSCQTGFRFNPHIMVHKGRSPSFSIFSHPQWTHEHRLPTPSSDNG